MRFVEHLQKCKRIRRNCMGFVKGFTPQYAIVVNRQTLGQVKSPANHRQPTTLRHGKNPGAIASSQHADDRLCARHGQARRSGNGSRFFAAYEPVKQWLKDKRPECVAVYLQRSRHVVFLRSLFGLFRWVSAQSIRLPTRAPARVICPHCTGDPALASNRYRAHGGRIRYVLLSGQGARSRLLFTLIHHVAAMIRTGRDVWCRCKWRAAVPDSTAARCFKLGRACGAPLSRTPRTHGCHRRYRGFVAPSATASAPDSITPNGTCNSSSCSRKTRRRSRA